MAYATLADLIAAFGEQEMLDLTDRDEDGVADAAVLASAQARAQSVIDGYLAGRYALPLAAPYPAALSGADADIQRYLLYDNEAPDRVKEAFGWAMNWLKDVASGKVALDLPAPVTGSYGGAAGYLAPERVWSADALAGF